MSKVYGNFFEAAEVVQETNETNTKQKYYDHKIYLKRKGCDHTDHISLAETLTSFYKEFYTPVEDGHSKNLIQ